MNNIDETKETVDQHHFGIDLNRNPASLYDFSIQSENPSSSVSYASESIDAKNANGSDQADTLDFIVGTATSNTSNTPDLHSSTTCEGIGNILRNARMAKGMSVDDVSRQLRLSLQQIDAIEREDFEKLPGQTFLRGFIRNYANLLQLDSSSLLKMLPVSVRVLSTPGNTPLSDKQISFSSNRKKKRSYALPIIAILFIFILAVYFLFGSQNRSGNEGEISIEREVPSTKSSGTTKEIRLPRAAVAKDTTKSVPAPKIESDNGNSTSVAVKLDLTPALTAAEPKPDVKTANVINAVPVDPSTGNLQFRFNGESWIRVVDGGGATLVEQINKAGSEHTVSGKKPFMIIIGNAAVVNLTYNGAEVDVASYQKQGGVARFKLE